MEEVEVTGVRGRAAPAPTLCSAGVGDTHAHCEASADSVVHAAYAEWGEHHNSCAMCGQHNWYMPGEVVTHVGPLLAAGTIRLSRNGHVEEVTYRRGYDLAVLCSTGTLLFRRWVRVTVDFSLTVGRRGRRR